MRINLNISNLNTIIKVYRIDHITDNVHIIIDLNLNGF